MSSFTSHSTETVPENRSVDLLNSKAMLRLAVWGASLSLFTIASVIFGPPKAKPTSTTFIVFYTTTTAAYLAVFTHCLLRFVYSRWTSWLLYTAGFGGLSFAGILGAVSAVKSGNELVGVGNLDLLKAAILPIASVALICAMHAIRFRIRERRVKSWKFYAFALLLLTTAALTWRSGVIKSLSNLILATRIDPILFVRIISITTLAALLYHAHRLSLSKHDEIVRPVCYWSIAMLIGSLLAFIGCFKPEMLWLETKGLELFAVAALVIGLTHENERAHRKSAQEMSDLEAMQRISWSLVGASNLYDLCDALAKAVSDNLGASSAAVYVPGSDPSNELVITATSGIDHKDIKVGRTCSLRPERRPGFHNGHTARAYTSGEMQIIEGIYSDVEFLPWRTLAHEDGIVVSVPLPYQGSTVGVLNLFFTGVTEIKNSNKKLLQVIAAAVAPAIANATTQIEPEIRLNYAA